MQYPMMVALTALFVAGCSGTERDNAAGPVREEVAANVAPAVQPAANAVNAATSTGKDDAIETDASTGRDPESPIYGDCYLKIDGKVYLDIRKTCPMFPLGDGKGGLILNSDGENEVKTYFAYLTPNGDGTAGATWNEEPGITHAQALLSENLKREGACWSDARVKICATRR